MADDRPNLDAGDNIGVRLDGVSFPNGRDAIVTFELFAWRAADADERRSLVKLPVATQRRLKEDESIDYDGIVRAAGSKLKQDFERVGMILTERYKAC